MSQRILANTSNQLNEESLNMYTINLFKTILQLSTSKIPIKKSDLVAIALNGNNKYFNEIFPLVKMKLKHIYGYKMNMVKDTKTGKQYFCTSILPKITSPHISERDESSETLLFICLSYIFMKGGSVSEDNILEYVVNLGISINEDHEYFGNAKKLILETFVKKLYLKKTKIVDEYCNTTKINFSWGQRSNVEVSKKNILDFVAKTLDTNIKYFLKQYNEIYVDEKEDDSDSDGFGGEEIEDTPLT